jgi:hypothetical protein
MYVNPAYLIDDIYVSPNSPSYLFNCIEWLFDQYDGLSKSSVHHSSLYDDDLMY